METRGIGLPPGHQAVLDRFVAACLADERVVAAFLGGSYAADAADEHSDLDLRLITTDAAYDGFVAQRAAFIRSLGEPVFLETFDSNAAIFVIMDDGTEVELVVGRERRFHHIQDGPYRVLVDRRGILAGATFPQQEVERDEQIETLRRLIAWFWHDLSHFIAAMGRGHLWWAHGQLAVLRRMCVNLARLDQDFSAATYDFDKVELAVPAERLSPLEATCCPLERDAMLRAGLSIVEFYRALAVPLARAHNIPYPEALDRAMSVRLEKLRAERRT